MRARTMSEALTQEQKRGETRWAGDCVHRLNALGTAFSLDPRTHKGVVKAARVHVRRLL